jgi:hypothetical protein
LCPRCGSKLILLGDAGVNIHIHVVESDLRLGPIMVVGWLLLVSWLALGYLTARSAAFGEISAQPVVTLMFIAFALYVMTTSDGLRLLSSVSDFRSLGTLGTVGYALPLGTWLLVPGYSFWAWIVGIVIFSIGWRNSLLTSRAPIRRTTGFTGVPLSTGKMMVAGSTTDLAAIRDRLEKSVFMLRSFVDDRNSLEEYIWSAPVGQQGGIMTETLERTLSFVAGKQDLNVVKLGSKNDAEASHAIDTSEQEWRTIVNEVSQKCRTIVLVPANTPGVLWEIEQLIDDGNIFKKTLFVFPKEAPEAAAARWSNLQKTFEKHRRALPDMPSERNWDPVLMRFLRNSEMEWFVARRKRFADRLGRRAYLWSLSVALDQSQP